MASGMITTTKMGVDVTIITRVVTIWKNILECELHFFQTILLKTMLYEKIQRKRDPIVRIRLGVRTFQIFIQKDLVIHSLQTHTE